MSTRIDDDMLKRLVSYEEYVEKLFARAAQKRWLEMNADVVQDYESLKVLKNRISSIVDLAFFRYGVENGLMRVHRINPVPELNDDLEVLAGQLQKMRWKDACSEADKHFASVC